MSLSCQVMSCINCNGRHSAAFMGCPEVLVRQRASLLRSKNYIPFSVAMRRAREDLKPQAPAPEQNSVADDCWSRDRTGPLAPTQKVSKIISAGSEAPALGPSPGTDTGSRSQRPMSSEPKQKRRKIRKKKGGKATLAQTALQYQLLLEQQKRRDLEKKLQEHTRGNSRRGDCDPGKLMGELRLFCQDPSLNLQEVQPEEAVPTFDTALYKLMLSLVQARLTGDCAPFLRNFTIL